MAESGLSKTVLFAIWRKPIIPGSGMLSESRDAYELERCCFNITKHFLRLRQNQYFEFIEDYSLTRMLNTASETGYKWLAVCSSGNLFESGIFEATQSMCAEAEPDVGIFGHLLDRGDRGYALHEQFFVINLEKWRQWGCGPGRPGVRGQSIHWPQRSPENVHDDYTPFWLKPGQSHSKVRSTCFGWEWLEKCLTSGDRVLNVPGSVRDKKMFLYPENNSERIYHYLCDDRESHGFLNDSEMSSAQLRFLERLHDESGVGGAPKLFLFNTEQYLDVENQPPMGPLSVMCSVASGFKDLFIMKYNGYNEKTELCYFDINSKALDFKRLMFESWDGEDFPAWFEGLEKKWPVELEGARIVDSREEVRSFWRQELAKWGGHREFLETYRAARKMKKSFMNLNIIEKPDGLSEVLKNAGPGVKSVWISNCFDYTPTQFSVGWDVEGVVERGREFLSSISQTGPEDDILLYGEDVTRGVKYLNLKNNIKEMYL